MLVVVTVSTGVPAVILSVAYKYFWQLGLALESFWCYQILATKSLKVESDRVYIALKDKGLEAGRKAVSMIVGRDTQNLTEEGVTKAAVETVAENTSDGVIAPLFYMLIGELFWDLLIRQLIRWIRWSVIRTTGISGLERLPRSWMMW